MLRFLESFDVYGTGATSETDIMEGLHGKWSFVFAYAVSTFSLVDGKQSGYALKIKSPSKISGSSGSQIQYVLNGTQQVTLCAGFYFKFDTAADNYRICEFIDNSDDSIYFSQVSLYLRSDGKIELRSAGDNIRATTVTVYSPDTWYYFELKATFNNTTGSAEFKVDGVSKLTYASGDTSESNNNYATGIRFFGSLNGFIFDDIYLLDTQAGRNTDFLGKSKVTAMFPADDSLVNWTPSAAVDHHTLIDDAQPSFTDYVYTDTNLADELFSIEVPALITTVFGLQVCSLLKSTKTDAKTVSTKAVYGGNTSTTNIVLCTGDNGHWDTGLLVCEYQPGTVNDWTLPVIAASQFGVRKVS